MIINIPMRKNLALDMALGSLVGEERGVSVIGKEVVVANLFSSQSLFLSINKQGREIVQ